MKYQVDLKQHGEWVTKASCDFEDKATFLHIANSSENYRIVCNGKDVTQKYIIKKKADNECEK